MLARLISGIVLGLGAAVPIGPVNVEIARRTLTRGYRAGFALGCGAVTVDVSYAILTSVGAGWLINRPIFYWPLAIGSIALLIFLAIKSFESAREAHRRELIITRQGGAVRSAYITGVAMTFINPMTIAFWFAVVPGLAGATASESGGAQLPILCVGVFIGTLSWVATFVSLLYWAGRYRKRWWLVFADELGGTLLLAFAGLALLRSVQRLL
ncbi:MAG TPA: LysE family transporter [Tepidisphaeraceae bacterium]|jgi:threonine/homoserine/homoserine lactone efflux protein|nr:LysE family transporter [Tepidisphaeraceae bacterium]